jgi:hypothetical protein
MSKTNRCLAKRRPTRQHRRGGALYIAVISTALIVSLLGLAGLSIVRIERNQASNMNDRNIARSNARSAVELALRVVANDSNWRNTYTNGVETTPQSLGPNGRGTVSWILEDTDGSLTDADTSLRLKGVGRVGNTVQVSSVRVETASPEFLRTTIHAGGNIDFPDATKQGSNVVVTTSGGPISCNGTLTSNSIINGDVAATAVVNGGTINGTITAPASPKPLPDPSIWDIYYALSVEIPWSSLPYDTSKKNYTMEPGILSPGINPLGPTSPDGVYYLNIPADQKVQFNDSRFEGTLVVKGGAGSIFHIGGMILASPSRTDFPLLIIKGCDVELDSRGANQLDESALGINFNPTSFPFQSDSDSDTSDVYDSEIRGLVHVIGALTETRLYTAINAIGTIVTEGNLVYPYGKQVPNAFFTWDSGLYANPPMGYATPGLAPVAGSWTRDVAP